jgi:hypothetical protein
VLAVEGVVSEQDGAHAALAACDKHGTEYGFSGGKQNLSVHGRLYLPREGLALRFLRTWRCLQARYFLGMQIAHGR